MGNGKSMGFTISNGKNHGKIIGGSWKFMGYHQQLEQVSFHLLPPANCACLSVNMSQCKPMAFDVILGDEKRGGLLLVLQLYGATCNCSCYMKLSLFFC